MNASSRHPHHAPARVLGLLLGLTLWLGSSIQALAQTCDIQATPAAPVAGQAFSLCGPSGNGFGYTWYDDMGNPVGEQQCLSYASGLGAGTYDWTLIVSGPSGMSICPYQLVVGDAPPPPPPPPPACSVWVDPASGLCGGQPFTLCAAEGAGLTYAWFDQNSVQFSTDRCVTLSSGRTPGSWDFAVVVSNGTQSSRCPITVTVADCARRLNCPRPAAFWARQCDQRGNRKNGLSLEQIDAVASSIDAHSSFFNWTPNASSTGAPSLCTVLSPARPMDARKQAKRQFAALLANVSAGALGVTTRKGEPISLDPNTSIACGGATTIAGLIAQTEQQLAQLETRSLSNKSVAASYRRIQECCEWINRGIGVGGVCSATQEAAAEEALDSGPGGFSGSQSGSEAALTASPNPFSGTTQLDYAVEDQGEPVDIGVYDVAGRLVRKLARGWQPAGTYQLHWDGRDASGVRMRAGVFFVRGMIGDRPIAARLLLLR